MKIEPVRGWAIFYNEGGFSADDVKEGHDEEIPVLVVPLTPESLEEIREKAGAAIAHLMHRQCWTDEALAAVILGAIGITEEPS